MTNTPHVDESLVLDDLSRIKNAIVDSSRKLLETHGEFWPIVRVIDSKGSLGAYATLGLNAGSGPQASFEVIRRTLKNQIQSGAVRAFGVGTNVENRETRESAIHIHTEHAIGIAIEVLIPYKREGGNIALLSEESQIVPPDVFPR